MRQVIDALIFGLCVLVSAVFGVKFYRVVVALLAELANAEYRGHGIR